MNILNLFRSKRGRVMEEKKRHDKWWIEFCNEPDNPFASEEAQELARQNEESLRQLKKDFPDIPDYISIHEYPCDNCNHKAEDHFRGYCTKGNCDCRVTRIELVEMHRAYDKRYDAGEIE